MFVVRDHNRFKMFEYENEPCETFQLGDVLLKEYDDEKCPIEIGVVIQTFSDGDVRTDMWGMCSPSEVRHPTFKEIKKYRPRLFNHINSQIVFDNIKENLTKDISEFCKDKMSVEDIRKLSKLIEDNTTLWY